MTTQQTEERVRERLAETGIPFLAFEHEPVHDYETAKAVRERFGVTAVESKSLFLKSKAGRYWMFVGPGRRFNSKLARKLTGSGLSVCSGDELIMSVLP